MKKNSLAVFLLFVCFQAFGQKQLKGFDQFAEKILNDWKIPGMAIGIVKGDSVYFKKGYGYRNLEQKLPVTTQTLFPIASVSKTFTGIDLCLLEEQGKVELDRPLREYIPDIAFYNDHLTNNVTLIDLLSHRTGLPSHDAVWWSSSKTRSELFASLKYLQPNLQLREAWQYSNLSYVAAGHVLQLLSGQTWEDYTHKNILLPLDMVNTNFTVKGLDTYPDFSYPYIFQNGSMIRKSFRNLDAVGPCGGINSSADDMLKYLRMLVGNGKYNGKTIISGKVLSKAQHPVITMPHTATNGSSLAYGLGFTEETFDKYLLKEHRGQIDGFTSVLTIVPEKKLGIIILANTEVTQPTGIVRDRLLEQLLNLPITDRHTKDAQDWLTRIQNQEREAASRIEKIFAEDDRVKGTQPSHALHDYTGNFIHPAYGLIKVEQDNDGLKITRDFQESKLAHYHYDYFLTKRLFPFYRTTFEFSTNADGFVDKLTIQMEVKSDPIVFVKEM